jgi:hypothetical protein
MIAITTSNSRSENAEGLHSAKNGRFGCIIGGNSDVRG